MKKIILVSLVSFNLLASGFFNNIKEADNNTKVEKVKQNHQSRSKTKDELRAEEIIKKIKKLKSEKMRLQNLMIFNTETKKIKLVNGKKIIKIFIPYQNITNIYFDKKIIKIETINDPKVKILYNSKDNPYKLVIENNNPSITKQIRITLSDEKELQLLVGIGNNPEKRYTDFKIYTNASAINLIPEFQKKLRVKNLDSYFNNVACKLINNMLQGGKESYKLAKNTIIIPPNKSIIHDGFATIGDLNGNQKINFTLKVKYLFKTPYVKNMEDNVKSRLILGEFTLYNKGSNIITITPKLIKEMFHNFVAFYAGNPRDGGNEVIPDTTKKILLVFEKEEEDEE